MFIAKKEKKGYWRIFSSFLVSPIGRLFGLQWQSVGRVDHRNYIKWPATFFISFIYEFISFLLALNRLRFVDVGNLSHHGKSVELLQYSYLKARAVLLWSQAKP